MNKKFKIEFTPGTGAYTEGKQITVNELRFDNRFSQMKISLEYTGTFEYITLTTEEAISMGLINLNALDKFAEGLINR